MRRALPMIAVLSLGFAPAPFPRPDTSEKDLAALQGEWKEISSSYGGSRIRASDGPTAMFNGNRLHFVFKGAVTANWIVTLDPSKKPKQMNLKAADVPKKTLISKRPGPQRVAAIYKIDGDTLTWACHFRTNASEKPTDFNPHRFVIVEVYKRKKR